MRAFGVRLRNAAHVAPKSDQDQTTSRDVSVRAHDSEKVLT